MSHPDDGTIQALLDGELSPGERGRVESHLAACASCAARLAEARAFMEEADQLVEVLTVPDRPTRAVPRARPRVLLRTLAWAASIVMAVGIGYWGRGTIPTDSRESPDGDMAKVAATAAPAAKPVEDEAPAPAEQKALGGAREVVRAEPTRSAVADAAPASPEQGAGAVPLDRMNQAAPPPVAAGRELKDSRADAPAMKVAQAPEAAAPTWQVISMEEAVRLLDGQIRLIDGLTPDRVESGPGTAVAGADPSLALVRVVYASGNVLLDQQRPARTAERRQEAAAGQVGAAARADGAGWREREGLRFVVTGTVSPDSIQELVRRVR